MNRYGSQMPAFPISRMNEHNRRPRGSIDRLRILARRSGRENFRIDRRTETLGIIAPNLDAYGAMVKAMRQSPALRLTPQENGRKDRGGGRKRARRRPERHRAGARDAQHSDREIGKTRPRCRQHRRTAPPFSLRGRRWSARRRPALVVPARRHCARLRRIAKLGPVSRYH